MAGLEGEERRKLVNRVKYVKSMHEMVKEEPVFSMSRALGSERSHNDNSDHSYS